jgi:hypothetical protein
MKIERLISLSEFVDIESDSQNDIEESYNNIVNHNDFLKQPLKKEMFVNEVKEPVKCDEDSNPDDLLYYMSQLDKWQEAEKKVIFDGCAPSEHNNNIIIFDDEMTALNFKEDKVFLWYFGEIETIQDLVTHAGEFALKNVEI